MPMQNSIVPRAKEIEAQRQLCFVMFHIMYQEFYDGQLGQKYLNRQKRERNRISS